MRGVTELPNCLPPQTTSEVWGISCFYLKHWHLLWEAHQLGKEVQCCAKKWFCDWGGRRNSEFQDNPTSLLPLLAGGRRFLIPNPKLYSPLSNQCSCEQLQGQAGIQSSKNLSPSATLHTTVLSAQAEPLAAVSCMCRSWCCLVVDSNELLCSLLGCSLQYL